MTTAQKIVAVGTIIPIAFYMHVFFCEWDAGDSYTGVSSLTASHPRTIIPLGFRSTAGIVARSRETVALDGLLGIAIPFMLVGTALFVIVTPRHDIREKESGG